MSNWCSEHWVLTFILIGMSLCLIETIVSGLFTLINNYLACKYNRKVEDE